MPKRVEEETVLVTADWRIAQEELPHGHLLRFRPEFAARTWSDPDDVRFASEIGVPHCDGLFRVIPEVAIDNPARPKRAFLSPDAGALEPVDTEHGSMQKLGLLYGGWLFVHLGDGTIWVSDPDGDEEYELIHRDLSSLAFLLYKVKVERPREEYPDPDDWIGAEEIIREDVTRWDQIPFAKKDGYWDRFFEYWSTL